MTGHHGERDLAALAAEAEAAVAAVKDPELRRVAFEKILSVLLGSENVDTGAAKNEKKAGRRRSSGKTKSSKPKAAKGKTKKVGPTGRVRELVAEGYFGEPRTIADVKAALADLGHHIPITSLSGPLQSLTKARNLRRQKVNDGNKSTYAYSEW